MLKICDNSLQRRLIFSLSISTLLLAILAAVVSATISYKETQAFQDKLLSRAAYNNDEAATQAVDNIQIQRPRGPRLIPLDSLADGYHNVRRNGRPYRVYVRTLPRAGRFAAIQPTELRNRRAFRAALYSAAPLMLFIPILMLLITVITRRSLAPLKISAKMLAQREEYDNTPIPSDNQPREIQVYSQLPTKCILV